MGSQEVPRKPSSTADALVASHRDLLSFVERRVGDRELAEEILQTAYVRGLEHLDDLRDPSKLLPWFYRLLRNAIAAHHRRGDAERRALLGLQRRFAPGQGSSELESSVCQCVRRLLPELEPEHADVLERVELEEDSIASYAAAAGITPNNARVRLHRARRALARALRRCCRTCAEHGCVDCSCGGPPELS